MKTPSTVCLNATVTRERRTEQQSEITLKELKEQPAEYIYNKIRMLQDPYPNAFIYAADERKIFITNIYIEN